MAPTLARTLVVVSALASVLTMTARTRADVDLWGHLRFGLDIVDARALHATDPYSFTSDRAWINHEWLSEVIIALAWRAGGAPALILLKLAATLAALALIAGSLKEKGITGHSRIVLLGLTLLGILPRIAQVRPQLFSVVLFAALMRILVRSDRGAPRALLWTIPVLVLWANTHGGWLVGVATVVLWSVGEAFAQRTQPRRAAFALGCGVAAAAATLLNPYGVRLWQFLFETVRFGREAIREWGPAWTDPATTIVWSAFACLAVAGLRRASFPRLPRNPAAAVIPIAWGIAALRVGRLDAFFAMSVVAMMAEPLSSLFTARRRVDAALPRAWQYGAVVLALTLVLVVPMTRRSFTCIGFLTPRWPEPEAVQYMHRQQLSGRIVTYFDWGEYAIWHMPAALNVSMDGRRETVYTNETIAGHIELYGATGRGLAYLENLHADYVWLPVNLPVVPTLQKHGWTVIFEGPRSVILARAASAHRFPHPSLPVISTAEQGSRCFPGP